MNSIPEPARGDGVIYVPQSEGGWVSRGVPGADAGRAGGHHGEAVAHLLDCPPRHSAPLRDPCCHPPLTLTFRLHCSL